MFVNLTPHNIVIVTSAGNVTIEKTGKEARVSQKTTAVREMEGIPLVRSEFGAVEGLPEKEEGVIFIVSAMVRTAAPEREDLASPGAPVRDEKGNVIGCKQLIIN